MSRLGFASVALLGVLVGACDDGPSRRPTAASDALWRLAPENARGGIVLSPYAVEMIERGMVSLRGFLAKAGTELDLVAKEIDEVLAPFGGREASLGSFGLTPKRGGAMFRVGESWVVVLPIDNPDGFLEKAHGTKATTPGGADRINNALCKTIDRHYVCAESEDVLASVGKGKLGDQLKKLGARGDVELVGLDLPLANATTTAIAAAQLERGSIIVRAMLVKPPPQLMAAFGEAVKPRTAPGKSAGFTVIDVRPMLADSPPLPLVEGVTFLDFVRTIAGPMTISVPLGQRTLDIEIPLSDPAPAEKVLATCEGVAPLAEFSAKLVDGTCRFTFERVQLELDAWVEGKTLHLGERKSTAIAITSIPPTPFARELAAGTWSFAFWGRGSMFAPTGVTPPAQIPEIEPSDAALLRITSMLGEAGFGARVEKTAADGEVLRIVGMLRTSFANPDPVLAKLADITAHDVIASKASDKAQAIADAHRGTPFAGDFSSGQLGMLVPTTMIGSAVNVVIPALVQLRRGEAAPTEKPPAEAGARTKQLVEGYAKQVYPQWLEANKSKPCPTITDLRDFVDPGAISDDEWGKPLIVVCGKDLPPGTEGIGVMSAGPDGKPGTPDDVKSF